MPSLLETYKNKTRKTNQYYFTETYQSFLTPKITKRNF